MDFPVNILLVDDHPENLLAIEAALSGAPYRLFRAYSGIEAKFTHEGSIYIMVNKLSQLS
ncbi:hypothetical protein [Paenibacillus monticola]|uniref:Response regulatory domain-containing protein n=1 Tax=Paenibacillus monticola TaxID=2666075 RepID=A0A7X2L5K1_9BACL|nr:hypothetical protein [Paenibacillus monticola]MRN56721.1 hypothetical protein [Paenibacillus monticola]